jgi:HEAT repeat protein
MATAALERSKTSAPAREYARKLAEQLSFGKSADRAAAARELAGVDSPESVRVLTDALGDPAAGVRAAAALALASLRDPASTPALAGIVAGWCDPAQARCRRAALRTLTAFGTEDAALALARSLATVRPDEPLGLEERSALLSVVYAEPKGVAAPRVVRTLIALLGHESGAVADRAVSLLEVLPAESHGPLARALRTASRAMVRRRAAQALGACRRQAAVDALVRALADPAAEVRAAAARSLEAMRDPATLGALSRMPSRRIRSPLSAVARGSNVPPR